jgi:hypothetical protein
MNNQQTITPIQLFDVAAEDIRSRLSGLSWMDNAYGRAETVYKGTGRERRRVLAVYQGDNEYTELYPRTEIGNFSYLVLDGPVQVTSLSATNLFQGRADASLVVFFDFRDVGTEANLTAQNVANEVLTRINTGLRQCQIRVNNYTDDIEQVFAPMDLTDREPALLMRPFGALRFRLTLTWKTRCD